STVKKSSTVVRGQRDGRGGTDVSCCHTPLLTGFPVRAAAAATRKVKPGSSKFAWRTKVIYPPSSTTTTSKGLRTRCKLRRETKPRAVESPRSTAVEIVFAASARAAESS